MHSAEVTGVSQQLLTRTHDVFDLLTQPHSAAALRRAVGSRLRSETVAYGLRRDLTVPHAAPAAKVPLDVRPLESGDDLSILETESCDLSPGTVFERLAQRRLIAAKLPTCWVAIGPDGKVCYMQWLIAPKENARIRGQWGDLFPQLGPGEALLEGAYTGDAYRGQGIMAHAMSRIAEAAREFGARSVQTFVGQSNIASLKGCKKAGFYPVQQRREVWRLLWRTVEFAPVPEGMRYPFD